MKKKVKNAYVSPVVKVAQFNVEKGYAGSSKVKSVGLGTSGWAKIEYGG